jgi:hypothetical protein
VLRCPIPRWFSGLKAGIKHFLNRKDWLSTNDDLLKPGSRWQSCDWERILDGLDSWKEVAREEGLAGLRLLLLENGFRGRQGHHWLLLSLLVLLSLIERGKWGKKFLSSIGEAWKKTTRGPSRPPPSQTLTLTHRVSRSVTRPFLGSFAERLKYGLSFWNKYQLLSRDSSPLLKRD